MSTKHAIAVQKGRDIVKSKWANGARENGKANGARANGTATATGPLSHLLSPGGAHSEHRHLLQQMLQESLQAIPGEVFNKKAVSHLKRNWLCAQ